MNNNPEKNYDKRIESLDAYVLRRREELFKGLGLELDNMDSTLDNNHEIPNDGIIKRFPNFPDTWSIHG